LGADTEVEPLGDMGEGAEALPELAPGRDAERLRPQPKLAGCAYPFDVLPMGLSEVLSKARQATAAPLPEPPPHDAAPRLATP